MWAPLSDAGPAVESIAAQEESTAVPNDEIKPDPATDAILHEADGPETKRARTDDDISVPQELAADITVEEMNGDQVAPVNGASSSFPTSITVPDRDIPAGGSKTNGAGAPDVVKLNQPQTQTDFAGVPAASALEAEAPEPETNKSVPTVSSVRSVASSSSPQSSFHLSHNPLKIVTNAISPCSLPPALSLQSTDSLSEATARHSAKEDKERPPRSLLNIKGSSSSSTKSKQTETNNINQKREKEYLRETIKEEPVASSSSSSSALQQNASSSSQQQRQQTQNSDSPSPSRSICVSNLVRPFTLPSLKEKLEDFGETEFFWINTIKSHCFVSVSRL
jgi:hypothetical protein